MFINNPWKLMYILFFLILYTFLNPGNYKVIYPEEKKQENKETFRIAGKICDRNGPIENAEVKILDTDMMTYSKKNGTFIIPFFPPWGIYLVEITKAGYEPYRYYLDISNSVTVVTLPILSKTNEYWEGIEFIESIPKYIESFDELERRYPSLPNLELHRRQNKFFYPGFYPETGSIRFKNFPYPVKIYMVFEDIKQAIFLEITVPNCEMYPNWYREEKVIYNVSPGKHTISFYDEEINKIGSIDVNVLIERTTFINFDSLEVD
jgi:Carboxypeptidase regulatory-like domain